MFWYNMGSLIRGYMDGGPVRKGYAAGGEVVAETGPETAAVEQGGVLPGSTPAPVGNPYVGAGAAEAFDPVANAEYYDPNSLTNTSINLWDPTVSNIDYNQLGGTGSVAPGDAPQLADNYLQDFIHTSTPIDLANTDQTAAPQETIGDSLVSAELGPDAPWLAEDILASNQTLENLEGAGLPEFNQNVDPAELAAAVAPIETAPTISHDATAPVVDIAVQNANTNQPIGGGVATQSYLYGNNVPGVNTGIPQGGHAADAISQYFSGANQQQFSDAITSQLNAPVGTQIDQGQLDEFVQTQSDLAATYSPIGGGNEDVDLTGGAGTLETLGGDELAYDNTFEQGNAENIAEIIEAGGINPETGDPNIVAGPNVLSAADEGLFGYGSDYNQEFVENYDAQSEHSANNPTGQTTGTPLYDQGYAEVGGLADTLINNSLVGTIGGAITGENLLPTYDDLLPPAESFSNYDSGDDGPSAAEIAANNNDGDPTNDTGNAGWGFTSVADLFDGGGPGASGDSYSGGIHGDDTVGDTSEGVGSIVSDWFGGGSSDSGSSDSGSSSSSSSGGGYSCYVATALRDAGYWSDYKRIRLIKWCMDAKPEGKLDTKLWRNGYVWFGKTVIAPRVDNKIIQWLSEGFYQATVKGKRTPQALLGKAFFYIPSYKMGIYKCITGKLVEIERT